jgi:ERCC4-type nuclease
MSTLKYYVWLASRRGVGAAAAGRALRHFGSAENVFFATSDELKKIPEIRPDEHKALNDKD